MEGNMNSEAKSTTERVPGVEAVEKIEAAVTGLPVTAATLYNKGLQRVIEVRKLALDLTAQQNADFVEVVKKALPPTMPGVSLLDLGQQALDRYIETEKSFLDLISEQGTALLDFTKERAESASKTGTSLTNIFQQAVERGLAVQKTVLDFAAQQNKAVSETQKELLDIAVKPLKASAAKA